MLIPSIHERKTWLGLLLGLAVGLNLFFNFSFKENLESRSSRLDQFFAQALFPFQWVLGSTRFAVLDSSRSLSELVSANEMNRDLRAQLEGLQLELLELERLRSENLRLRKLLDFEILDSREYLAARVQGQDPSLFFKSLTINRGSRHGVQRRLPVVNTQGVVGSVIEVAAYQSKVLLITDLNARVDAVVHRSRSRVIVGGAPEGMLQLRLLPRRQDVRVGDLLVTSGLDGVFPAGFEIGRIKELRTSSGDVLDQAILEPKVDFESLEELFVILPTDSRN